MKNQLIYPMALYVFYTFCLALFVFRSRLKALKSGQVSPKYFKTYVETPPPENVLVMGRHYDNQFQVPMLFFMGGILHYAMGMANSFTLILLWAFVMSRFAHAWVHLGSNKLQPRVLAFALGWLIVVLIWAQLVYFSLLPLVISPAAI